MAITRKKALAASKSFSTSEEEDEEYGSSLGSGSSSAPDWTTSSDEDDEETSDMSSENEADDVAKDETPGMVDDDTSSDSSDSDGPVLPPRSKAVKDECTPEERVRAFDIEMEAFMKNRPRLYTWMDTWSEVDKTSDLWLNVYGYCDKGKGHGGYGVILRNGASAPLVAATGFSPKGGSQLFQVLNGLKTGLDLASKHGGYPGLTVCCNSRKAVTLRNILEPSAGNRIICDRSHVKTGGICKDCIKMRLSIRRASLDILLPVSKELKDVGEKFGKQFGHYGKFGFVLKNVHRDQNVPAKYLAGLREEKELAALKIQPVAASKKEEIEPVKKEIQPADFPRALGKLLWNDAFGCTTMYSLDDYYYY